MKTHCSVCLAALGLGIALTVAILMLAAQIGRPVQAAPICARYVVSGGFNSGNCASSTTPCKTIQYALQQAASGDRICVADRSDLSGPTTYYGTVVVTKSVTLNGGWETSGVGDPFTAADCPSQNVVIDGQGLYRVISITGNVTPTIQCFTITGGNATGQTDDCYGSGGHPDGCGGGIFVYSAHPIIVNNIITNNFAAITSSGYPTSDTGYGGGIYLMDASQTIISGNVIISNAASTANCGAGGGIYLYGDASGTRVQNNQVLSNTATTMNRSAWGGGIYGGPDGALIQGNWVEGNRTNSINTGSGAGLYQWFGSAYYQGNLVQRNYGGSAVYLGHSQSHFENNRVVDNGAYVGLELAYGSGGGPTLVNNVVARNSYISLNAFASAGSPLTATLLHNTLVGTGSTYGVHIESGYVNLFLTNTIITSHTWGITNTFPASSTILADHTLFWANTFPGIQGNDPLNGNPTFAADGYHILLVSAAIDTGVDAGVTSDLDGDPRPNGPGYDIGADEAQLRHVYLPIILRN